MHSYTRILLALLANFLLGVVGIVGGLLTGSMALISNSIHSIGDSLALSFSFVLEKKSHKKADEKHSFGHRRLSIVAAFSVNLFMLLASALLILEALESLLEIHEVHEHDMIPYAIFGMLANFFAAVVTNHKHNRNERAVSLHAVQDLLSWASVIVGALIIHETGFAQIDAVLSIVIASAIIIKVSHEIKPELNILLNAVPDGINPKALKQEILALEKVEKVEKLHIWSVDGEKNFATLEIATSDKNAKEKVVKILRKHRIDDSSISVSMI